MKKALIVLGILALQLTVVAQKKSSYLYLEINKNLPVEVKLNNVILRNEHKGYIIVPKLAEGEHTLEFEFTNPSFATHVFKFTADGKKSLGLKLARVTDNRFVLQDVVNKRIINDENTLNTQPIAIKNDNIPAVTADKNNIKIAAVSKKKATEREEEKKEKTVEVKKATEKVKDKQVVVEKTVEEKKPAPTVTPTRRSYAMYRERRTTNSIQNSTRYKNYNKAKREARRLARLNAKKETEENTQQVEKAEKEKEATRARATQSTPTTRANENVNEVKIAKKTPPNTSYQKSTEGIGEQVINAEPGGNVNTKSVKSTTGNAENKMACTSVVRTERITDWTLRLHKKFDDEARANYIKRRLGNNCISTNNLGVLLGNLETQIGRYKLIKMLYPKLEDPNNTERFYKYFTSQSYIEKIKELQYEVN